MWTNAPYPYRVETRGLFEFQHHCAEKMNAGVFATVQVMGELSMLLLTIPVLFPAIMGLELWGLGAQDKGKRSINRVPCVADSDVIGVGG